MLLDQPPAGDSLPQRKPPADGAGAPRARFTQDTGAGVFLLALAALGGWQSADLSAGTLRQFGPGLLPRALSVLTGLAGVALVARSWAAPGEGIGRWPWRGPACVLGSAVLFGLAIRPLGLAVAGPVTVLVAMLASAEKRWGQALLFALALSVFCIVLFKVLLRLPLPLAPWLLDY